MLTAVARLWSSEFEWFVNFPLIHINPEAYQLWFGLFVYLLLVLIVAASKPIICKGPLKFRLLAKDLS